jgi:hypothetical protein
LLVGSYIFDNFLQKNFGHLKDEYIYIYQSYFRGSGSRYNPVTVRVGDQLVWVTLEGEVPLHTSYAPSSDNILGMKG